MKQRFWKQGFVLLLVFQAMVTQGQLNINHYIRVGETRIAIGNYVGAIEYFNIVIRFKPYMPEPYFFRGVAKHMLDDYHGAILDYEKAIEIKPFYPDAYSRLGMAYHALNDFPNAIRNYNKSLELNPDNEGVYNNRGIAKISQKDVNGAIADYDKALEINPGSTNSLMNRSNAKIIKGDIKGAIQDLNQVIMIRPHFAGAYLNRGLARFELNDFASALRDFDQCIKLEPDNALAYNNRGIIKQKLEDYNGAIMDYDMAIRLDPGLSNAYFNRAMAREILKRPGYESDYQIAADLNPQYDLSRFTVKNESPPSGKPAQSQQKQNNQPAVKQGNQASSPPADSLAVATQEKNREEEIRRRRRMSLIMSDTRNLQREQPADPDDPFIQNRNIQVELQPLFMVSASEKNPLNYERLQYYNAEVDAINVANNYQPMLTITNKDQSDNNTLFRNNILYFNEKIRIAAIPLNYLNRGIFYLLTDNFKQSLDDLNKAIELDPASVIGYLSRGNCRSKMVEMVESLATSQEQINVTSRSKGPVPSKVSQIIPGSSDYDLILADYTRAVQLQPAFFFGFFNRAYIYLKQGKYPDAMDDLNKAIALEPEFAEAYYNRGLTRIYMNDTKGGAIDLSKAGELGLVEAYSIIKRYCN
ncbi:MAG TPA: tetratricopeptide repeat protein [Prolixibacteraceae bacterium]|nr:tetratricopeptide repeat protein [Prolixibacteraceae bacterium]